MKTTRLFQLVFLAAVILPSSGCFALWTEDVDPLYEIDDDEWVVVKPFQDPNFPRSPWDSPTGHEAALLTTEALKAMAPFNTVSYSEVLELMVAPPSKEAKADDELGLDVRTLNNKQLSDLVAADYVLVCKIVKMELKDPMNVNMTKGTATVEASLFKVALTDDEIEEAEEKTARDLRREKAFRDAGIGTLTGPVAHGGKFVASGTVTVHYPDDYLNQYGTPFLDPQAVREKLLARLGHKVAELWYEHEPDEGLGTGN